MSRIVSLPPRLQAMADQRVALLHDVIPEGLPHTVVMTPLTERPRHMDRERWERTCDNCGVYVPEGRDFYTGTTTDMLKGRQVIIGFGLCRTCVPEDRS